MTDLRDELATYIGVLSEGASRTTAAGDRTAYTQHLAAAAEMLFLLHKKAAGPALERWVAGERRAYGWGFLSGKDGEEVESAFQRFAAAIENAASRR